MVNYPLVIVGYDRPDYLRQCLTSLRSQVDQREVLVLLDFSTQELVDKQIEISKSIIPGCKIYTHNKNVGAGINMIYARDLVFDVTGADAAFIIEDDLVMSPYYLRFCENLMAWANNNYDNVGVVQGWNENLTALDNDVVEYTHRHWWGYLMKRQCWSDIKIACMNTYVKYLTSLESYQQRHAPWIDGWAKMLLLTQRIPDRKKPFPVNKNEFNRLVNASFIYSSQDSITALGMLLGNYAKIAPYNSRAKYIGEHGIHYNPTIYKQNNMDKIPFVKSEDDLSISEFKVNEQQD